MAPSLVVSARQTLAVTGRRGRRRRTVIAKSGGASLPPKLVTFLGKGGSGKTTAAAVAAQSSFRSFRSMASQQEADDILFARLLEAAAKSFAAEINKRFGARQVFEEMSPLPDAYLLPQAVADKEPAPAELFTMHSVIEYAPLPDLAVAVPAELTVLEDVGRSVVEEAQDAGGSVTTYPVAKPHIIAKSHDADGTADPKVFDEMSPHRDGVLSLWNTSPTQQLSDYKLELVSNIHRSTNEAADANGELYGRNIYDGCGLLHIKWAHVRRIRPHNCQPAMMRRCLISGEIGVGKFPGHLSYSCNGIQEMQGI